MTNIITEFSTKEWDETVPVTLNLDPALSELVEQAHNGDYEGSV